MTLDAVAERLQMGAPGHLSHVLYWEGKNKSKAKGTKTESDETKVRPLRRWAELHGENCNPETPTFQLDHGSTASKEPLPVRLRSEHEITFRRPAGHATARTLSNM